MSTNTTTAGAAKLPDIRYAIGENGDIQRTDKDSTTRVANLLETTLRLVPEHAKFRPAVVRWLNAEGYTIKSVLLEGDTPAGPDLDIPPMPKKSMRDGDKTPEVVEWYRKYKPEEYRARYGIQGTGRVERFRDNGEVFEEEVTVATRKIHLTEKPVANIDGDGEYND